jgi:hypothetical protein
MIRKEEGLLKVLRLCNGKFQTGLKINQLAKAKWVQKSGII